MTHDLRLATSRLDSFIRKKMRDEGLQGLTVSVTDRNRLLWQRQYGLTNADSRLRVNPDTLFQIGSISKSFACVVLMQLVEQGKVDLNWPVKRYLPWLEIKSKHKPITLHHLLSHTAGIVTGTERTVEGRSEIWALRDTEATARPGEMFHYSNVGYKIVGEVISRLEGKSCGRVLQERVIRPLGMKSTASEITHDLRSRLAVGYWLKFDDLPAKRVPEWAPSTWIESETADGSISSTSLDMSAYVRMLLNRGKGPSGKILSEKGYRMLTQKAIKCDDGRPDEYYGYGLSVEGYRGHTLIGHTGSMLGFISSMRLDVDEGIGAFASTNCLRSVDDVTRLAVELLRRVRHHEALSGAERVAVPASPEPQEYAGTYTGAQHFLEVRRAGRNLVLKYGNEQISLQYREKDSFYADHPSLDRYFFRFGRNRSNVVEVFHGDEWYANARYEGKRSFRHPKEWVGLTGHYRSHNPWIRNFRVVVRKGELVLVVPGQPEEPLVPIGGKAFRVGQDKRSPERMTFDAFIDGQAHTANLSGCEFARTFTP